MVSHIPWEWFLTSKCLWRLKPWNSLLLACSGTILIRLSFGILLFLTFDASFDRSKWSVIVMLRWHCGWTECSIGCCKGGWKEIKSFVSVHLLFQLEQHLPSRLTEGEARGEGNHQLKSCYDYLHGNRKCPFFLPRVAELEISENLALLLFPLSFSSRTLFAVISTQPTQL